MVNHYPDTMHIARKWKKSQLASIELLNGVSNVDGKRWMLASVKEAGVNVNGKRWMASLRWANGCLTCMNVSVVRIKRPSHKKGNLFYTRLNASKLESHQTGGWVYPGHAFREITI